MFGQLKYNIFCANMPYLKSRNLYRPSRLIVCTVTGHQCALQCALCTTSCKCKCTAQHSPTQCKPAQHPWLPLWAALATPAQHLPSTISPHPPITIIIGRSVPARAPGPANHSEGWSSSRFAATVCLLSATAPNSRCDWSAGGGVSRGKQAGQMMPGPG